MTEKTFEEIAKYRQLNGIKQIEVANHIKVDKATYSRFEAGKGNLQLRQLLSAIRFVKMPFQLPEKRQVIYSDGILDEFEKQIDETSISFDYSENTRQLNDLMIVFNKVIEERGQYFNIDFEQDDFIQHYIGRTIVTIELDPRGEELIGKAIAKQNDLFRVLFPQK